MQAYRSERGGMIHRQDGGHCRASRYAASIDAAAVNVVLDANLLDECRQRRSFAAPSLYGRAIPAPATVRLYIERLLGV
jgi:hypothetical protein